MSFDGRATIITARSNSSVSDLKFHNNGVAGKQGREKAHPYCSARQHYLRSYAFKKKETVPQKAKNCLIRVKDTVTLRWKKKNKDNGSSVRRRSRCWVLCRRTAKVTAVCSKAASFWRRVLSCPAKVGNSNTNNNNNNDIVDQGISREKSNNTK